MDLNESVKERSPKIILSPPQEECLEKSLRLLEKYPAVYNSAKMGRGKTYVTCALAQKLGLPIFVVKLLSITAWDEMESNYNIHIPYKITYGKLRGKMGVCNNPYLINTINDVEEEGKGDYRNPFKVTEDFKSLVQEGILLVADEISMAKNNTGITDALHACIKCIGETLKRDPQCRSRVVLLSAPYMGDNRNVESLCKLLYLTPQDSIYYESNEGIKLTGYEDIVNLCAEQDEEKTLDILPPLVTSGNLHATLFRLYENILKKIFTVNIKSNENSSHKITPTYRFSYYIFPEEDEAIIREGFRKLQSLAYSGNYGKCVKGCRSVISGKLGEGLSLIEKGSISTLIRVSKQTLIEVPKSKVIIYINQKENNNLLMRGLQEWNPVSLRGDSTQKERKFRKDLFQNDPTCRVLVAHILVGGVGINLDDQRGDFPRYVYLLPGYDADKKLQGVGRVIRRETKSNPVITVLCSTVMITESKLVISMCNKTDNMRRGYSVEEKEDFVSFSDYDRRYEMSDGTFVTEPPEVPEENLKINSTKKFLTLRSEDEVENNIIGNISDSDSDSDEELIPSRSL